MIIGDFCYAAVHGMREFLVTQGQAVIIGTGLVLGLLYVIRQRIRSRDQKYLTTELETAE